MAPTLRRRFSTLHNVQNNFDYFRSFTEVKRKRSFKDTLRRTKTKMSESGESSPLAAECHTLKSGLSKMKEYDLEQKIELEIRMREGTSKLLAACHHPVQSLEAAKSLLTSNERMLVYVDELHRRRDASKRTAVSETAPNPCKAKVCVSDLRMPLIWKDSDHFKNRGDYRRFAVFCLLKLGTEIYDTAMINRVDRSMTDICFDDSFVFHGVPHNFAVTLEVYSHVLHDDLSIASTPRKIRHRINESLSRTVGRKLAATLKEELNAADFAGPKFELIARSSLNLEHVDDNICTHDLSIENTENIQNQNQLPLFGHFCCRLAALPEFLGDDGVSGFVSVQQDVDGAASPMWATLKGPQLLLRDQADEGRQLQQQPGAPTTSIPINKFTVMRRESTSSAISVTNVFNGADATLRLILADETSCRRWFRHLEETIVSHATWQHAAESAMTIRSPVVKRLPLFSRTRKASLYEQTPLKDSPQAAISVFRAQERGWTGASPLLSHRSRSGSTSSVSTSSSSGGQCASGFAVGLSETAPATLHTFQPHETSV